MSVSIFILKYWKNRSSTAFSWGKRRCYSPYWSLNWPISWTPLLSLFNFKWTFSEAMIRRAASLLVSSIIATDLKSAPIIGLHPTIPTCRQAAGRPVPTLAIWTWICLHCTHTLSSDRLSHRLLLALRDFLISEMYKCRSAESSATVAPPSTYPQII